MSGYSSVVQQLNPEMVDILRTDFQHRNEPNFAWKSAVSTTLAFPALIASWPMSALRRDNATDRVRDVSGSGYHLTANTTGGTLQFYYDDLAPFANFVSANSQFLDRADGGAANWADVTGTENYIGTSLQGLTIGGWFWFDAFTANRGIIGKYNDNGVNQRSYMLYWSAGTGAFTFIVSPDGAATTTVTSTVLEAIDQWYCIICTFDNDNNEISITVNGTTNTAVYNNTIFDSTADFNIGAYANGASGHMDGRASLCFPCASFMSTAQRFSFFQQTRAMFGV